MDSAATSWRTATWRASFVLLRDELLEREAFDTLLEAKVLIERWRQHYNTIRPHGALGYRAPPKDAAALCGCYDYASATTQGWSVEGQNPNLKTCVIHGGRSTRQQGLVDRVRTP
jgi:transposase InsO family protein